ncbi:membrane protein containing RDD domain protein [Rhodopirellula maiorica SM1]|uniref:Membrane protein containing RDD domain protein n=1 Tax=Rhodopirellula maiorica SM1 TaxID=1265738 RepID=M5RSN2_9BACT|nr:RDD family protein [Rhodopirellula maiorica]EMI16979.1 membrane protein containing RDD domain protein [Rhodopirellula maiorica SM1]
MKIKCPACSAVLNIPESAAGKVVKCPCGKQLRAPGGAAKPAAAAAAATPNRAPVAQQPAAQRRAPQPAGPSAGDFDPAMFDDLTDDDLKQPVLPVQRPGGGSAPSPVNPYAIGTGGAHAGGAMPSQSSGKIASIGQRIGGALLDGLFNMSGVIAASVLVGLLAPAADAAGQQAAAGISVIILLVCACVAMVPFVINMVLISKSGQSVGKKVAKTRMVNKDTGIQVGFLHGVLIRNLVFGAITGIPIIGGLIALADIVFLFSENHETLHDKLAQTLVVEA